MRLDARKLATEELRFESDGSDGRSNLVTLGPSSGVTGGYQQDATAIVFDTLSAESLLVTAASWSLPRGRLAIDGASALTGVAVNARINRQAHSDEPGFVGSIRAKRIELPRVSLTRDAVTLRLESVVLEDVDIEVAAEETRASASAVKAAQVHVQSASFEFSLSAFELPEGLSSQNARLTLPAIKVGDLSVKLPDLVALRSGGADDEEAVASSGSPSSRRTESRSDALRFLDSLAGRLHVDLKVDATIPLLGRRRATHRFRVPVQQGTIDYHELEHDLASLEDAVLDFRVKDGKLCLERDLSMLRFWSKVLVYWELEEPGEVDLANRRRVRLRRLASPRVPEPRQTEEVEKGKKGVVVRQLDFNNLDVALNLRRASVPLGDGAQVRLGAEDRDAVKSLTVEGDVCYQPGRSIDPTELDISAEQVHFGLDQLRAGSQLVDIDAVDISSVRDVAIKLEGVKPTSVAASVSGIEIRRVVLAPV